LTATALGRPDPTLEISLSRLVELYGARPIRTADLLGAMVTDWGVGEDERASLRQIRGRVELSIP